MPSHELINIVVTVGVTQFVCDMVSLLFVYRKEPYQRALSTFERSKWKRDRAKKQYEESLATTQAQTNISTLDPRTGKQTPSASTAANAKKVGKHSKNHKAYRRAEEDCAEAAAEVARRHAGPGILTSVVFLVLLRILGTEYQGKVIGVLPFQPFKMLRRLTMRGMVFSVDASSGEPLGQILDLPNPAFPASGEKNTYAAQVTNTSQSCAFIFVYLLCTFSIKHYVHQLFGQQAPQGADQGLMTILESPKSKKMLNDIGMPEEVFNPDKVQRPKLE